jgi:hypothetical protein
MPAFFQEVEQVVHERGLIFWQWGQYMLKISTTTTGAEISARDTGPSFLAMPR